MLQDQVSPAKRAWALLAAFLMMVSLFVSFDMVTTSAPAHADTCSINSSGSATDAGAIVCPTQFTGSINTPTSGNTTLPGHCAGVCSTTPIANTNVTYYPTYVPCAYGVNGKLKYPLTGTATCYPQYGYSVCVSSSNCSVPVSCPAVGGKSAIEVIVDAITTAHYDSSGRRLDSTTVTKGYCVYPSTTINSTKTVTNASTTGYCAYNVLPALYYSMSATTITTGSEGSANTSGVSAGSAGGGTKVKGPSSPISLGLDDSSAARLAATCKTGKYSWSSNLPADTVNGGSVLGYYRETNLVKYQRCFITSYGAAFGVAPQATCNPTLYNVYDHSRFTNTCRYGLVAGVHTEYEKYFDPATCSTTWTCNESAPTIAGHTAAFNTTRNGENLLVKFSPFSVSGVTGITNQERYQEVVAGSTPFYGSDPNSINPPQFFTLTATGTSGTLPKNTLIKFKYNGQLNDKSPTVLGTQANLRFTWASDLNSAWQMKVTYTFHGTFSTKESSSLTGSVQTTPVKGDGECSVVSPKVNVLRSVNTN